MSSFKFGGVATSSNLYSEWAGGGIQSSIFRLFAYRNNFTFKIIEQGIMGSRFIPRRNKGRCYNILEEDSNDRHRPYGHNHLHSVTVFIRDIA